MQRVWSGNAPFHIAECHAVKGLREGGRLLLRPLSIVDGVSVRKADLEEGTACSGRPLSFAKWMYLCQSCMNKGNGRWVVYWWGDFCKACYVWSTGFACRNSHSVLFQNLWNNKTNANFPWASITIACVKYVNSHLVYQSMQPASGLFSPPTGTAAIKHLKS